MELDLGLKFTRVADGFTSDVHVSKDRANPMFLSRETDAMYILTAHLKGYKRGNIKIDINEGGNLISVKGERRVKETVIVGGNVYKKDEEVKGFKKVFVIPQGVILDKINAKFNEDESNLTITMPKKVKGIIGKVIDEIKVENDEKLEPKKGKEIMEGNVHEERFYGPKQNQDQNLARAESSGTKKQFEPNGQNENDNASDTHCGKNEHFIVEPSNESTVDGPGPTREEEEDKKNWGGKLKICTPIVAGSALLLSFVVFVIQIVRNQNKRKN